MKRVDLLIHTNYMYTVQARVWDFYREKIRVKPNYPLKTLCLSAFQKG